MLELSDLEGRGSEKSFRRAEKREGTACVRPGARGDAEFVREVQALFNGFLSQGRIIKQEMAGNA